MTLLINIFVPAGIATEWSSAALSLSLGCFLGKLLLLSAALVLVETTNAKLRLFRVPDLLSAAFILAALALVSTFLFQ
jgi:formate hydrogenlyase subunit 4